VRLRASERRAVVQFLRRAVEQARARAPWPSLFECRGERYRLVGTNLGRLMIVDCRGEALAASGYGALD